MDKKCFKIFSWMIFDIIMMTCTIWGLFDSSGKESWVVMMLVVVQVISVVLFFFFLEQLKFALMEKKRNCVS